MIYFLKPTFNFIFADINFLFEPLNVGIFYVQTDYYVVPGKNLAICERVLYMLVRKVLGKPYYGGRTA